MGRLVRRLLAAWIPSIFLVALALPVLAPGPARAETEVDLALVLAVDISYSMDPEEQALQREGFAEAFRSRPVQEAIRRGMLGRIAVVYMEWAGSGEQRVVVPWTVIDDPESILAFADRIASTPLKRAQRTSISGAIDAAAKLFDQSGVTAQRRVIDVSGDGPNNQGRAVTLARDEALRNGIVINGLPIMLKRPGYLDIAELDEYYRDCVIGGQGSFMVPVRSREQFPEAIRTKILMEVAGRVPPEPLIRRVQAPRPANCFVGEAQWRDRMGN
jgi:hypothetical protein